jgi:hypothetical protein
VGIHSPYLVTVEFLTTASYSAPKRPAPSIKADIRAAEGEREYAREQARMTAMWGPPVYGLVDIRDRIGTRANAPLPAAQPARAISRHDARPQAPSTRAPPRPRVAPSRPRRRRKREVEVLIASMNKDENEVYQQQRPSTRDAAEEPRRRLRSTRVKDMNARVGTRGLVG